MKKITLYLNKEGQVIRSTTEPWIEEPSDHIGTVPSPPLIIVNEQQQRLFDRSASKLPNHPVWSSLKKPSENCNSK